jgi:hypothetical protein
VFYHSTFEEKYDDNEFDEVSIEANHKLHPTSMKLYTREETYTLSLNLYIDHNLTYKVTVK